LAPFQSLPVSWWYIFHHPRRGMMEPSPAFAINSTNYPQNLNHCAAKQTNKNNNKIHLKQKLMEKVTPETVYFLKSPIKR